MKVSNRKRFNLNLDIPIESVLQNLVRSQNIAIACQCHIFTI